MSKINSFLIDTNLMSSGEVTKSFTIKGKPGAEFTLIALQDGTLKYYNFETDTFDLGHAPKSNLSVKLSSSFFRRTLVFPDGAGTYVIKLLTNNDTLVVDGSSVISKTIEKQGAKATITFAPASTHKTGAADDNYQTLPTSTSQGSVDDSSNLTYDWTINNASTDDGGYGLIYHKDVRPTILGSAELDSADKYFYVQTTKAILDNPAGDGEDSTTITVSNTTGLSVGMELFYHKASVSPVTKAGVAVTNSAITSIDVNAGIVYFDNAVAFEDGETMTLRAYGSKNIHFASDFKLSFSNIHILSEHLIKPVRGTVSASQTITLTDTHGISGGNTISYTGLGVNNSANNRVNVVTPDCPDLTSAGALDNDGQITVELAQTLTQGTSLRFLNIFKVAYMSGEIQILSYPTSDVTVNLDLDKILTPGVSGS